MDIITQFNERLAAASVHLGFDLSAEEQGSYNWHMARLGVITASEVSQILGKSNSATYNGYMAILIAEIATGAPVDAKRISVKELEWGKTHEGSAREMYQFMTGDAVSTFTMLHTSDMRCGFSPDGLIVERNRGAEIKCPWNTRYHIEALCDGTIKKDYMDQVQFSMWVSGLNEWEFVSFDPRMRKSNLFHTTVERSDRHMKLFDDAVPQFCLEMDRKLELIGFAFGDQWK